MGAAAAPSVINTATVSTPGAKNSPYSVSDFTTVVSLPAVTLSTIATGFNGIIGVDYHQPSQQVLISANYPGGHPHNFELVAQNGSRTPFSTISGLTNEVYISAIRSSSCQGGFTEGEAFTGTGVSGQIARTAADGSSAQIPWVTLPGESGGLHGGLFQDHYCAFGGDLIVVTDAGGVWRVTSSGVPTRLGSIGTVLEGPTTVPNDPKYGPWAGKIVTGAELSGGVYAIDVAGAVTLWPVAYSSEHVEVIPAQRELVWRGFRSGEAHGRIGFAVRSLCR